MAKYIVHFTKDISVSCHISEAIDRAWEELESEWKADKDSNIHIADVDFDDIEVEEIKP